MTTVTVREGRTPLWPLLIPLAGLLLGMAAAVISTNNGRVKTTSHAVERHGAEAERIRCQLQDEDPLEVWEDLEDPCVRFWLTQLGCGKFAIMIVQTFPSLVEGCDLRELTSFTPRDGTYQRVTNYLSEFARRIR